MSVEKIGTVICGVILTAILLLTSTLLLFDHFVINHRHPSDADMIKKFYKHKAQFEELREMLLADKDVRGVNLKRIVLVNENKNIPEERIMKYRTLLSKLDLNGGVGVSANRKNISFTSSLNGWATHNSEKGYMYTDIPIESTSIFSGLDTFKPHEIHSGVRLIEKNWYLYYDGY
jgi:hypothetical protein